MSRQKVHLVRSVKSPIPLSVWLFPAVLKVSRRNSWVPASTSKLSVIPADTRVVPSASARYWSGAAESGRSPKEIASMRIRTEPGSIVFGDSVTWARSPERQAVANTIAPRAA